MAKMVLPKDCPRDQIWQPYLVPRGPHIDAIGLVLGQNMAARLGSTMPDVVLVHGTKLWLLYSVLGPIMTAIICPRTKYDCYNLS